MAEQHRDNVVPLFGNLRADDRLVRGVPTSNDVSHSGTSRTSTPGDYLRTQFQARMAIGKSLEDIEGQIDLLRAVYGPLDIRVDMLGAVALAAMKHFITALDGPEPPEKIGA